MGSSTGTEYRGYSTDIILQRQRYWHRCNLQYSTSKLGKLKKLVINHKVDIIGMAECNVDWRSQKETLADRFEGWFSHKKVICSNNWKINPNLSKPFQSGGTAMIATNATASFTLTSGVDPQGLGRWSWIRLTGKHGLTTRIISAYCPIKNPNPS